MLGGAALRVCYDLGLAFWTGRQSGICVVREKWLLRELNEWLALVASLVVYCLIMGCYRKEYAQCNYAHQQHLGITLSMLA